MIRGLEKIKSREEYDNEIKALGYDIKEYKWISESKDPKKEVETEFDECIKRLRQGMEQDEEVELSNKIQTLKTKLSAIDSGEYKATLKRNIIGRILRIEHFEAANQNIGLIKLVKGLINGDQEVKEYMRKKYMFTLANMYGTAPAPESLNTESVHDILEYMAKTYDFVDIDLSDALNQDQELGMVLVDEPIVGIKSKVIEKANSRAETYINSFDDVFSSIPKDDKIEKDSKDKLPVHEQSKLNQRATKDKANRDNGKEI